MVAIDDDVRKKLIEACIRAKEYSYSPYSNFRVGCAILTACGKIITGCNVENVSFGLTICAERTAYVKAVSDGYKSFLAVAVSTDVENTFTYPCGACRQFMSEFGDVEVICVCKNKSYEKTTLATLLPNSFEKVTLESGQENNPVAK